MRTIRATVTQRGQVTIPAEIRRFLGLDTGDKVEFVIDEDQVLLAPVRYTLESAYGSVTPIERPEDFEARSRDAKEEHADHVVSEMREQ